MMMMKRKKVKKNTTTKRPQMRVAKIRKKLFLRSGLSSLSKKPSLRCLSIRKSKSMQSSVSTSSKTLIDHRRCNQVFSKSHDYQSKMKLSRTKWLMSIIRNLTCLLQITLRNSISESLGTSFLTYSDISRRPW